jgi:hypothetical protein|tara:strand:- start:283 stop:522 length:240 start_codon:yes stop_codon:yes gene_type:complete
MQIHSIKIIETEPGADVEISLGDAPSPDDVREWLSLSVHVDYDRAKPVGLEKLKELAFDRVKNICVEQRNAAENLQNIS